MGDNMPIVWIARAAFSQRPSPDLNRNLPLKPDSRASHVSPRLMFSPRKDSLVLLKTQ
jgi:hypothetical protein